MPVRVRLSHEHRTAAEEPPATARPDAPNAFGSAGPLAEDRDAAPHGSLPVGPVLHGNRRHGFLVAPENRTIHRGTPLPAGSRSIRLYDLGRGRIPGRRAGTAFQPDARVVEPGPDVRGLCGGRLSRHCPGPGCSARQPVRVAGFLAARLSANFYAGIAAACAAASVLMAFAADRPGIVSFLGVAVFVSLLELRRGWWALPPLALLWSNCHGGFLLGWVVLLAYCRRDPALTAARAHGRRTAGGFGW